MLKIPPARNQQFKLIIFSRYLWNSLCNIIPMFRNFNIYYANKYVFYDAKSKHLPEADNVNL